jgi:diguanylate cyclase (GGDEF)-like protein
MNNFSREQISIFGSFKDKDLELSYQMQTFSEFHKIVVSCVAGVFALFLLFSLPELASSDFSGFIKDISVRFSSIAFYIIIYYFFGRFKNYKSYIITITILEFSFSLFYILILMQYANMNFSIKCMDIIILVTVFFVTPNKLANSIFSAITLILSFTIFCLFNKAHFTQDSSYVAGSVHIVIAFSLNAFSSFRFNFYKRSQFYDNVMLQNLLNTDTLTGAFTRVKFDNEIKKQIAFSQQTGRKMSLAIFDIDNFKRINDTYGHLEGDNVLSGIANIVIENLRLRDILTRWGGEEFVIVFPCTGLASAVKTAERLRIKISDAAFSIGEVVTCSFGVTEFKKGDTPVSLLRRADNLLYEAKASGKNVVCAN